ncbi:DUF4259 domain-containing protein [Dactylosporangium siamense]|uniref:Uncharacterized protein n=1 Tax=Dactylosporangium siamense TaxID=685454 RepID=A0A919Q2X3_9ACTN|nr:DUF4259 domain-containing protein [Dactylosporangium siamense]GIG52895.1 hypothetical protein Dsi01nite_109360 [Dactylosporangium siamense]
MGTFGTGPFSSDGAMDFLGELAERPPERRGSALARMFLFVKDNPELLWREFFPDEVVAAAAVVAAALPGGQQIDEQLEALVEQDLVPDVRLPAPASDLAGAALQALTFVAGPEGPWHQGWTNDTDAAEARETIAVLSRVLTLGAGAPE